MLTLLLAISATAVRANPMLELCLPVAPAVCALTKDSPADEVLKCFADVSLSLKVPAQRACASELLHAKLHKACDSVDIPKLCKGVKPGDNRMMKCLGLNSFKISKPCKSAYDDYMLLEGGTKQMGRGSAVSAVRC